MRDILLLAHILLGFVIIILSILLLINKKASQKTKKILASVTALISWIMLYPSGKLYLLFYPATKTVVKAGSWPWAHDILMETKEHWGLLIPVIATVAAFLVFKNDYKTSRKWWILLILVATLIGIMGRIIKIGAMQ